MSNWIGTGAPVIGVSNTDYSYPHTLNGGREERWEAEVSEVWTTLSGDRIYGDRELRFVGEYTWVNLSDTQLENLLTWYNQRQVLSLRPYSDTPVYQISCRVEDVQLSKGGSIQSQDKVTVRFEAINRVTSIPVPDNTIYGFNHPLKGVV